MGYGQQSTERQRFRSFCERYLIARAPFFDKGREEEDAWDCMLKCRSIYKRLDAYSSNMDDPEVEDQAAPQQQAQPKHTFTFLIS